MDKTPYVHVYVDLLEAMGMLAHGSNSVVFHTIGLLMPTKGEDGVKVKDVAKYTGLSSKTILAALEPLMTSGLIQEQYPGTYIAVKYIEYRKERKFLVTHPDDVHLIKKNQSSNQSNPSKLITGEEFKVAYNAFVTLVGGMVNPTDAELFGELWDETPDAELHKRAVVITKKRADRPNFKYYASVVRSGAVDYETKEEKAKAASEFTVVKSGVGFYG